MSSQETRARILTSAYKLFYKEGFARVSVDSIADAAEVTKRTLYYHFKSKDALVADVLSYQHEFALSRIQEWGGTRALTPRAFVAGIFRRLSEWVAKPRWLGSGYTRLTMELADLPGHPARAVASSHKKSVEDWMTSRLKELGQKRSATKAKQIVILLEGAVTLTLIHGGTEYVASAAKAADELMKSDPTQGR